MRSKRLATGLLFAGLAAAEVLAAGCATDGEADEDLTVADPTLEVAVTGVPGLRTEVHLTTTSDPTTPEAQHQVVFCSLGRIGSYGDLIADLPPDGTYSELCDRSEVDAHTLATAIGEPLGDVAFRFS